MKKSFKSKLMLILFLTITILQILQVFSLAVEVEDENIQMIKKNENEYIIYISGMLNQEFEFAFSNSDKDETDTTTLVFEKSALDKTENGNNIAYIDSILYDQYFKENEETFLWVKKDETYKIEAEKVILAEALTEEDIEELNNVTKKFYNGEEKVVIEVGQKELPQEETEEGVKITRKIGTLKIVNGGTAKYSYNMVKATEGSNAEKLIKLATEINRLSNADGSAMYEKLSVYSEFKTIYNELEPDENVNWTEVIDSTIEQPEESKDGEQYLVWIKQETENEEPVIDVQIMTCEDDYIPEYDKKEVVIKETTKLPITGDSIVLFVIAGIVIILIAIVTVLKLKNSKNGKHTA